MPSLSVLNSASVRVDAAKHPDPLPELGLVDLAQHFLRFSRFLYADATLGKESTYEERDHHQAEEFWGGIAAPLHIGGSIKAIEVTPAALNPDASMMCSHAWDFDLALSELTALHVKELTRFMWAWIALEKLVDLVCFGPGSRTQKLTAFLTTGDAAATFLVTRTLTHHAFALAGKSIRQSTRSAIKKSGASGLEHIHLCREARNALFHSHSVNLEPDDWGPDTTYRPEDDHRVVFPRILCRLTLLTIQSALFTHFRDSTYLTGQLMQMDGVPRGVPLPDAVRGLHLAEVGRGDGQLDLFLCDLDEDK
jgi:hypothetical protein